jgi:hypothetical protein
MRRCPPKQHRGPLTALRSPNSTEVPYLLITDGLAVNPFFLDWRVTYTAATQMSLLLTDRCVTFAIDLHDAYHLCHLAGCGQFNIL